MNNQSDPSDEITCSNCGRPNLRDAVKCWYCQSELTALAAGQSVAPSESTPSTHGVPEIDEQKDFTKSGKRSERTAEDLPDWLKRIRELKQQDQVIEEEKNKWQQQDLFKQSLKDKSKPAPPSRAKPDRHAARQRTKPVKDEQVKTQPALKVEISDPPQTEALDNSQPVGQEKENQVEDLPEGFNKFEPKSH